MAMRPIVVGGPPGMGIGNGIGFPMAHAAEPGKKFTSQECLQALMDRINDEPTLIRNHIQLMTSEQRDMMNNQFWPAIFDAANWTRISTKRPDKDEEGNTISGTDLEVREYENDVWADESKVLTGLVYTEFGEIKDIKITVKW